LTKVQRVSLKKGVLEEKILMHFDCKNVQGNLVKILMKLSGAKDIIKMDVNCKTPLDYPQKKDIGLSFEFWNFKWK